MQRSGEVGVCCYVVDIGGLVLGRGGEEGEMEVGVQGAESAGGGVGVGGGGHGRTGERARVDTVGRLCGPIECR